MRKKKLYPILVLVILFSMSLLYAGCGPHSSSSEEIAALERLAEKEEELLAEKEEERLAKAEEEKQTEVEQASPDKEVTEDAETEEDKLIPDEPIKYSGRAEENAVILIVNFKTTKVTGSVSQSESYYVDATVNGKININTFKVTSNFSGIWRDLETGEEFPFNGIISGIITDDLGTFNGIIQPDYLEEGVEFIATK